jgi:hypothetical protein
MVWPPPRFFMECEKCLPTQRGSILTAGARSGATLRFAGASRPHGLSAREKTAGSSTTACAASPTTCASAGALRLVSTEIPVYNVDGRLLTWAPAEWCERHAGNLRLVRSRRGVLKRCYLRADDGELVEWLAATGRRSSFGAAFQQMLPCGRVWALRGVRGSGR